MAIWNYIKLCKFGDLEKLFYKMMMFVIHTLVVFHTVKEVERTWHKFGASLASDSILI